MLRIEISDNGPGVAPELKEKIFDRFQQASIDDSRKLGGAGLGLAICKSIVEQHGGQIGVDSEPGAGAKFWFTLPLCESAD
jgi:signal transduction histidine kinase